MTLDKQERAHRLLARAHAAQQSCMLAEALGLMEQSLALDPGNPAAHALRARILLRCKQPGAALASLDAHDLHGPARRSAPGVNMLRVEALLAGGYHELAGRLADQLARDLADDPRVQRRAAAVYLRLDRTADAIAALQRVLRVTPSDCASRTLLCDLLGRVEPERAIALLEEPGGRPTDPAMLLRYARLCTQAGRDRDAAEAYDTLAQRMSDDPRLLCEAADAAARLGEMDAAIGRLKRALNCGGSHRLIARARLSELLTLAGRWRDAAASWWWLAHHGEGRMHGWAGLLVCGMVLDNQRLIARAERGLATRTSRAERRALVASVWRQAAGQLAVHRAAGDLPPAEQPSPLQALLRRSAATMAAHIQQHPRRADSHYHHARLLSAMGLEGEADMGVQRAIGINPSYAQAQRFAARRGRDASQAA